jgi:hypothetical protein
MKFFIKTKLSENISETPEGFLLCRNVPLTHTGALTYRAGEHPFDEVKDDMIITRTPEELFSDATVSSFEGKSITIEHPSEFVSPENWQELSNGVVMNVRPSPEKIEVDGNMEDALLGDFLITVKEAIAMVKDGLREVSLGYDALWVQTGDDTAVHTKIRGNHCALVDSGRAGINCAIKDSKGELTMKLADKYKKFFGKTVDEAVAEKEKEEKKASDEAEEKKKADEKKAADELEEKKKKDDKSEDEEESEEGQKKEDDRASKFEERLDKMESMLAEFIKKYEGGSEDDDEESEEVVEDEDEEDKSEDDDAYDDDEAMDADEEKEDKKGKAGDSMKRAEILAPGIKAGKDLKRRALDTAYKNKTHKKVIDSLLGGKSLKDTKDLSAVFVAASELIKTARVNDFASVKAVSIDNFPALSQKSKGSVTADDINKKNAEFYSKK